MNTHWRTWVFYVAAAYDGVLGLAFLFFWPVVFRVFGVTPPNHGGYVQFPALLLIIFAFLFLRIARDPDGNRELIAYGMGLKASYAGLVFLYQFTSGVPGMWVPWAWFDLIFLALFYMAWRVPAGARSRVAHA